MPDRNLTVIYRNGVSVQRRVAAGVPDQVRDKYLNGGFFAVVDTYGGPLWTINLREVIDMTDTEVV